MTVPFYSAGRAAILLVAICDPNIGRSQVPRGFFSSVSYSVIPLQSIDCFCSYRRLIVSLLASFALVHRHDCFCSSSRQFHFSPPILSALLVAHSASVRRLFLLFSSINRFSSRHFCSSPLIGSALLVDGFGRS